MDPPVTTWISEFTSISGEEEAIKMEIPVLTGLMSLVGLAGNTMVLWLLGFRMRRNHFSLYILSLAGADFLLLCCDITYALETIIRHFYSIDISIPGFFIIVLIFAYVAGLSFLSAISMERCLSVLWPIWYRCRRPRHLSVITCALLWALSLLLSIVEGNYCGFLNSDIQGDWCPVLDDITVGWLILLCVILSGSNLALLTRLLCGSRRVPLTRLYLTVVLTGLFFLLFGLPLGIYWFLFYWFEEYSYMFNPQFWVGVLLSSVNSCANPIIYFFVGSYRRRWWKGRQTLRLVLQRALQDTPEVDVPGEGLPQETLDVSGGSLVS